MLPTGNFAFPGADALEILRSDRPLVNAPILPIDPLPDGDFRRAESPRALEMVIEFAYATGPRVEERTGVGGSARGSGSGAPTS